MDQQFDVFLCHNSKDKRAVLHVSSYLGHLGIRRWIDRFGLIGGTRWRPKLFEVLNNSASCLIFLGPHGWGPIHEEEARYAVKKSRNDESFRVIIVLLPGYHEEDKQDMQTWFPEFIDYHYEILREVNDEETLIKLAKAIRRDDTPLADAVGVTAVKINIAAQSWEASGHKNKDIFFRGRNLKAANQLLKQSDHNITDIGKQFIYASSRSRWKRAFYSSVGSLVVLSLITTAVIVAVREYRTSQYEQRQRFANTLAQKANEQFVRDPELGFLLATQAVSTTLVADNQVAPLVEETLRAAFSQLRVAHVLAGHTTDVTQAVFSPDSALAATASRDGTARLWDAKTGRLIRALESNQGALHSLIFSVDGKTLLTGGADGSIWVWDVARGTALHQLHFHEGAVLSLATIADTSTIIAGDSTGLVILVDLVTQQERDRFKAVGPITSIGYHRSTVQELLLVSTNEETRAWRIDLRQELPLSTIRTSSLVAINLFGQIAYADDIKVHIADVADTTSASELATYQRIVTDLEYSPNGRLLAITSTDQKAHILDVLSGQEILLLVGHSRDVNRINFSPDGRLAITASADGTARIWDIIGHSEYPTLTGAAPDRIGYSPDNTLLVSGAVDGLSFRDVTTLEPRLPLSSTDSTYRLEIAPGGASPLLWRSSTGEKLKPENMTGMLDRWAYSKDGKYLALSSFDHTVVWDIASGRVVLDLSSLVAPGSAYLAFCPDSRHLLVSNQTLSVWDVQTRTPVLPTNGKEIIAGTPFPPTCSSDSTLVAPLQQGSEVRIIDIRSGNVVELEQGHRHSSRVTSIEFNPNNQYLLTGSEDFTAQLWNATTGAYISTLRGHTGIVSSAGFSPNGELIATVSQDGTAKIWDTQTGTPRLTLTHFPNTPIGVTFSPDGQRLAIVTDAGTIHQYTLDHKELLRLAVERAPRGLNENERREFGIAP